MRYTVRPLSTWDGPRTAASARRSRWTFKAPWSSTIDLLGRELELLAARNIVLEADFREQDLRLDGLPRSNARQPIDPAVRIAFDSKYGSLVYASDSCEFWQHNVRSVALGLEALRAVDRYGITRRAEQYQGWRQIGSTASGPAPIDTREAAADFLVATAWPDTSPTEHALKVRELLTGDLAVANVERMALRRAHPDVGGSAEAFIRVQEAVRVLG